MIHPVQLLQFAGVLLLAPLLLGVINRVKAFFAGRRGPPLLQIYRDLNKLLRKGAVYSRTTGPVFRMGPWIGLGAIVIATLLVPYGARPAVITFEGDLLLLAMLYGLSRFLTVIAALDTASPFEGMGASREAFFGALAEPVLILALAAIAHKCGSLSLSGMMSQLSTTSWRESGVFLGLVAMALFVVYLTENARIPVDDPNTHLELTMIHEVMVLDHSGPDFAAIEYGSALKLWGIGALIVAIVLPVRSGWAVLDAGVTYLGVIMLAALVGMVESSMARLRLLHVPLLLIGGGALSVIALLLVTR